MESARPGFSTISCSRRHQQRDEIGQLPKNGGAISATRTRPRLPRVIWRYVTYGDLAASTRLQSCDLHNSRPTAHPVIFNWSGVIW